MSYLAAPPSLPDRRHFFLVAGTPPSPVANAGAVVGTTNVVERDFKGIPYPGAPNGRFAFEGTGCKPAAPTFRLVFALSDATAPPDLAACNYRGSMRTESGADYLGRNTPTGAVLEQTNFRLSAQGQCDGVATPLAGRLKVAIHCTEGQPVVAWKSLARVRHRVDSLWQFDAGKTGNRTWDGQAYSVGHGHYYGDFEYADQLIGAWSVDYSGVDLRANCDSSVVPNRLRSTPISILYVGLQTA